MTDKNHDHGNTSASARYIAQQRWLQLIDDACSQQQVATAAVLRAEGMLQLALELGAVDRALLQQWGEQAATRLAAAIQNPQWPKSAIDLDGDQVRITILLKRAPVYRSTPD